MKKVQAVTDRVGFHAVLNKCRGCKACCSDKSNLEVGRETILKEGV